MQIFEQTGAYLRGHFRLTSGLHSPGYLQCAKVLQYPAIAERLGAELAARLRTIMKEPADIVVAPAMGGLIIGHEVARALGVPFVFTERDPGTREMVLRRGFALQQGAKAVVIEDVITTGGSSREVVAIIRALGARAIATGSIMDRSGGAADVGVPRVALATLSVKTYGEGDCPMCAAGQSVTKPGSRPS